MWKKDTVLHGFVVDINYMEHEYPEFLILEKSQTQCFLQIVVNIVYV